MNYVLFNREILQDYIDNYLPDLLSGETYFVRLLTRQKWVETLNGDKNIKNLVVTKENMIDNIKHLECEIPSYNGLVQDEIALYITPNPRNYDIFMRKTIDVFQRRLNGTLKVQQDPFTMMFNILDNSCSRKVYHCLNFNNVNPYLTMDKVLDYINHDCVNALHTKGGVIFLIKRDKINLNKYPNWLENILKLEGCVNFYSKNGDFMIPIPGTIQFGFRPEFIK